MDKIIRKTVKRSNWISLLLTILGMILSLSSFHVDAADEHNSSRESAEQTQASQYNLIKAVQNRLIKKGYNPGNSDGILGPRTRKALEAFQRNRGLKVDGLPGKETLKALGLM